MSASVHVPEYTFIVSSDDDDAFVAVCAECPRLVEYGHSRAEALARLERRVETHWRDSKEVPPQRISTKRILDGLLGVRLFVAGKRFFGNMKGAPTGQKHE